MPKINITICSFVFVLSSTIASANNAQSVKTIINSWKSSQGLTVLNDFRDLLSLPNVANDLNAMAVNADWIESYLSKRNFKTQRLSAGGAPYIFAELKTPGAEKTVLIYAHFDGQPVKPQNWQTPAWSPQLRDNLVEKNGKDLSWPTSASQLNDDWRIFARSAGDDKAPVIALMAALDALKAAGLAPKVNIKLFLDGEEEAGSPTLQKVLSQHGHLLKSDLMLFCDGPMHQSRKRQLVFGVRGVSSVELTTYGPLRPLHSGHYGNWAPNAAEQMVEALATLHDKDRRIAIKNFYKDVPGISKAENQAIDAMPNIDAQLRSELAINSTRLKKTRIEEAILQPGLIITGIQVGSTGDNARNVLVPQASASINFRLVPNQTPKRIREQFTSHFQTLGYTVTDKPVTADFLRKNKEVLSLKWSDGYPAFRASLESPMAKQLKNILTELSGEPPLMTPTMGGSLPIYIFESVIDAPIIILPIANHDNNQHGPNENLRLGNLWQAIEVYAAVLTEIK